MCAIPTNLHLQILTVQDTVRHNASEGNEGKRVSRRKGSAVSFRRSSSGGSESGRGGSESSQVGAALRDGDAGATPAGSSASRVLRRMSHGRTASSGGGASGGAGAGAGSCGGGGEAGAGATGGKKRRRRASMLLQRMRLAGNGQFSDSDSDGSSSDEEFGDFAEVLRHPAGAEEPQAEYSSSYAAQVFGSSLGSARSNSTASSATSRTFGGADSGSGPSSGGLPSAGVPSAAGTSPGSKGDSLSPAAAMGAAGEPHLGSPEGDTPDKLLHMLQRGSRRSFAAVAALREHDDMADESVGVAKMTSLSFDSPADEPGAATGDDKAAQEDSEQAAGAGAGASVATDVVVSSSARKPRASGTAAMASDWLELMEGQTEEAAPPQQSEEAVAAPSSAPAAPTVSPPPMSPIQTATATATASTTTAAASSSDELPQHPLASSDDEARDTMAALRDRPSSNAAALAGDWLALMQGTGDAGGVPDDVITPGRAVRRAWDAAAEAVQAAKGDADEGDDDAATDGTLADELAEGGCVCGTISCC